jgi:heavy metal sensor kinase
MFIRSIRWRFQLWLAFLLVAILSGFGVTAYRLHRGNRFDQVDLELQRRLAVLSAEVHGPPPGEMGGRPFPDKGRGPGAPPPDGERRRPPFEGGPGRPPPRRDGPGFGGPPGPRDDHLETRELRLSERTLALFDEADTNGFYHAVWSRRGKVLKVSSNAPREVPMPTRSGADTTRHLQLRGTFREAFHFTEMGECVLVGRSIVADLAATQRFGWWLAAGGASVLALGLGVGWWLVTQAMRPVEDMSAAASRISAGNLAERINVTDTDNELGRLARVLNSTFARLETAFAQQKQFTADASHELRTPLAVILSEAQTALARERSAAEYRDAVVSCLDAAQQMRRLTESLLQLARFDAGQEPIERRPFDLTAAARACVERIRPLAEERNINIQSEFMPVAALGDADCFSQVITNLLINAIHYNKDGGEIRVITNREEASAVLTIADTGPGIPEADLPHIFERFYRADKSRARANGRNGLGLAISKAIVEAHGGRIDVVTQPGMGTTFVVRLPASALV